MSWKGFEGRVAALMIIFLTVLALLVFRLAWLQLVVGHRLAATAANYHSRTVYYRWGHGGEGRGAILDRQLRPFTEAKLQSGLAVFTAIGQGEEGYEEWLQTLTVYTGLVQEEIIQRSDQRYALPLTKSLPQELVLPHWIVPVEGEWDEEGNFRRYSFGDLAGHVLGVTEKAPGKQVGVRGIELEFDQHLRCRRLGVSALTDAWGNLIPGLGYRNTMAASEQPNVVLTIDIEIQQLVEKTLDKFIDSKRIPEWGAAVVMDPENGDILAMCSRPVARDSEDQQNRATRKSPNVNLLPFASMVKVVTAAAALEKDPGLISACYACSGKMVLGANTFECSHGPHNMQDMAGAMANSCNLYFAQLAQEVGAADLLAMAEALGLGSKADIGLPAWDVEAGSLPRREDLATAAGLANNFALGGNKMEVTPLQAAVALSTIANGGWHVEPRLVLGVNQDLEKRVLRPPAKKEKAMSVATAQAVAMLLRNVVVLGKTGGFDHSVYPYAARELAFKTGTSDPLPPKGYYVSWCGGFFPWHRPEYVVVYLAEAPGGAGVERGSLVAEIVEGLARLSGEE